MIGCHLSPRLPPLSSPTPPIPPTQRKPAIQSGAEIKSLGVWPGPRPLANEVRERQPKSLPLGLYCLYRGLVIGGYGSGIKRLLPPPLRRVRHSLRSSSSLLPPPSSPPFFSRGKEEEEGAHRIGFTHGSLPHPLLPVLASLRLCSMPAQYRVRPSVRVCQVTCRLPVQLLLPVPPILPHPTCCPAQWFCGCWLCRFDG